MARSPIFELELSFLYVSGENRRGPEILQDAPFGREELSAHAQSQRSCSFVELLSVMNVKGRETERTTNPRVHRAVNGKRVTTT